MSEAADTPKDERARRLAQVLRENLRRRKAQAREVADGAADEARSAPIPPSSSRT